MKIRRWRFLKLLALIWKGKNLTQSKTGERHGLFFALADTSGYNARPIGTSASQAQIFIDGFVQKPRSLVVLRFTGSAVEEIGHNQFCLGIAPTLR